MKKIKTLLKNLKYMMKNDLSEKKFELQKNIYDNIPYEMSDYRYDTLNVLNYGKTIDLLLQNPKSFVRFGDGEMDIIEGKSIPFQRYESRLALMLKRILACSDDDIYVGINYHYFNSTAIMNDFSRQFCFDNVKRLRDRMLKYCNRDRIYIAAGFNQLYMMYSEYNFEDYYRKIKELFRDRELVIFAGDNVFKRISFDVFESAKSQNILKKKSKDDFSDYDQILREALATPRKKLLFSY